MTDPTDDPNADLAAALRRELAGAAVPHDGSRADAMIGAATAADLLPARSWPAPLAAAAAVVVIGGGAATFAAVHGGGGTPAGGGPGGGCATASPSGPTAPTPVAASTSTAEPGVSSSTSVALGTAVPLPARGETTTISVPPDAPTPSSSATNATPLPSDTDDPCPSATPSTTEPPGSATPSAVYPLPPTSSPSSSTSTVLPSAGVGTPSAPNPSPSTVLSFASVISRLSARPGETVTREVPFGVEGKPSAVTSIGFDQTGGMSGAVTVLRGARATTVRNTLGSGSSTIDLAPPLVFSSQAPLREKLTCAGPATCTIHVTVTYTIQVVVTRP